MPRSERPSTAPLCPVGGTEASLPPGEHPATGAARTHSSQVRKEAPRPVSRAPKPGDRTAPQPYRFSRGTLRAEPAPAHPSTVARSLRPPRRSGRRQGAGGPLGPRRTATTRRKP